MSDVAQFGWLEWPVAVHWGDIMFTLVYTSAIDQGSTPSLATVTGLPQTGGFNQHSAVNVGKPPKYSTFQSPSTSGTATATGWVSAVKAIQFNQPVKFCVSIPGPPPVSTVPAPTFYAWRGFAVGDPLHPTFILSFEAAFAYQNDPTVIPWCYYKVGNPGFAYGMGPATVAAGDRASAQAFLDWQNSHCSPGAYGPGGLPSGVEEVPGTAQQSHTAIGGAMLTTMKKDGTVIDKQEWDGHASSGSAADAQICFAIDNKGMITMTVSAPGWSKGPPPAG